MVGVVVLSPIRSSLDSETYVNVKIKITYAIVLA